MACNLAYDEEKFQLFGLDHGALSSSRRLG